MPVHQEGMAVAVDNSSGLLEFTQDLPYDVDKRDDQQRIPFKLSEVWLVYMLVYCASDAGASCAWNVEAHNSNFVGQHIKHMLTRCCQL